MIDAAALFRVRGLVQGVGFRPAVWRLARRHGLRGWVANDGEGVQIRLRGAPAAIAACIASLAEEAPPLARIDLIERTASTPRDDDGAFHIAASVASGARTGVAPDAATCVRCRAEVADPSERRHGYPFTNCTDCGPRLSIIEGIPYDRPMTTMRHFTLCDACAAQYRDPADRRFHAQPIACHECGPRAWLEGGDRREGALEEAASRLTRGQIVAVKGIGGFQLACDATNEAAVARLRAGKRRPRKPLALMVRDIDVARDFARVSEAEAAAMASPAAPIVLLVGGGVRQVAANVAPGVRLLGVMLANTPLHHLLLQRMDRPIVLTSGNVSDEPQCIDNDEARERLAPLADSFLLHDRPVARRVDDSVVQIAAGVPRVIRRARGFAPAPLALPDGFRNAPPVLAMGGELKSSFCLLRDGQAILSHHMGDLADPRTFGDYERSIDAYLTLFDHAPAIVAVDRHPDYHATRLGRELARQRGAVVAEVQHHHAHIAACMAEHGIPLEGPKVLGVALDGLGLGLDGSLWGGEFLLADYRCCERLATFKPVAMPGGEQAIRQPWRNTYAHLMAEMGWARVAMDYAELDLTAFLASKPRASLDGMMARGLNSPLASSCGRLFDAVAAACGICREVAEYEGQAAVEFEALVDPHSLAHEDELLAYRFAIRRLKSNDLPAVEPLPMWQALLGDLVGGTDVGVIAARFHKGLASVIARMVDRLVQARAECAPIGTVVLSGGVLQNRTLLEQLVGRLAPLGLRVLIPAQFPANDGGLALGQAVIASAAIHDLRG
jgi:hydrogenase maturation protein HypF